MKKLLFITIFISQAWVTSTGQKVMDANVIANAILLPEETINTSSYEFSPVFYGPYIGFVNDRGQATRYDEHHNTPFFDLSFAGADTEGNLSRQATFISDISSDMQEGPFCFNPDQSIMYFTRTEPETGLLQIYRAERKNNEWKFIGKANIDYSGHHCHPTISQNGKKLVFAGSPLTEDAQMDLYEAERIGNQWTNITKLPQPINSNSNDWFPRYVGDSILVFASQREDGYGGLDIYASKRIDGQWSAPELLGKPINGVADDFGLIIGDEIAYFSSNRIESKGKDDLFRIEFKGSLPFDASRQKSVIGLQIKNKLTLRSIPNAEVKLIPVKVGKVSLSKPYFDIDYATSQGQENLINKIIPEKSLPILIYQTESNGEVYPEIINDMQYVIKISAPGYSSYNALYSLDKNGDRLTYVLEPAEETTPKPTETGLVIPTQTGSVVIFDHLYYDFNSYNIQQGAAAELDVLAEAMLANPQMKVQLAAHTDSRGSKTYNQRLSEKRAVSAKNYLLNKGISSDRIVAVGYGESQLRNQCKDRVKCSEEEHQYNRRTEVKILEN